MTRQAEFERLQAEGVAIEQARTAAEAAEAAARARLQEAQAAHAGVAAEEKALVALLAANQSDLWPSLVNAVTVTPGLRGGPRRRARRRSRGLRRRRRARALADPAAAGDAPPACPRGVEPLAAFVRGPDLLARRLTQIGVVAGEAEGRALAAQLVQGQRLVTRDGAMWRWDGFAVAAGAVTAAETRLRQRTRLDELQKELAVLRAALGEAEAGHGEARRGAAAATAAERQWRDAFQASMRTVDGARAALEAATQRALAATSRAAALDEAAMAMGADVAETETQLAAARADEAALPDLAPVRDQAAARRTELAELRGRLIECRSAHDRLQRESQARAARAAAIAERAALLGPADSGGGTATGVAGAAPDRRAAPNSRISAAARPRSPSSGRS